MNIQKIKYSEVVIGDKINFKMDGEKAPQVRIVVEISKVGKFLKIVFDTKDSSGYIDATVGYLDSELNKII